MPQAGRHLLVEMLLLNKHFFKKDTRPREGPGNTRGLFLCIPGINAGTDQATSLRYGH